MAIRRRRGYTPLHWIRSQPIIGIFAVIGGSVLSVLAVWFLARRQSSFFSSTVNGVLRTHSIDRSNRLELNGPHEQQRIVNAVNRLAEGVEVALAESNRSRAYHETILNELTVGILVVDADGILQYANPSASSTLDFTFNPAKDSRVPLASRVSVYDINDATAHSVENDETVLRNVELFDSQRQIEVVARPFLPDENGNRRTIVIINDRTDEMRLGVSLREFVANASHELRTPIASIQASVDTLKMGDALKPSETSQFLDRIDDSTKRMGALVTEMMELTMLETGREPLNVSKIHPSNLIDSVLMLHGPVGTAAHHEIENEVIGDVPEITVDVPKMERAIGNLLGNAQKFTPPSGRIRITCRKKNGDVVFAVQDDGEGIDPDDLHHIFERFYKSHRSSGDRTGFGLGLAITQNIVEMHDGRVEVESTVGEGSTFRVILPIS